VELVNCYKKRTVEFEDLTSLEKDFGGLDGICQKLKVDLDRGLTGADFIERT